MNELDILYIVMKWPTPSETFCARDILALGRNGVKAGVYALKPEEKTSVKLKESLGVLSIESASLSIETFMMGLVEMSKNPVLLFKTVNLLLKKESSIKHIVKSILLLPSVFSGLKYISNHKPRVVHLFWGHYPSLLGFCLKNKFPNIKLSMFLGAYDLSVDLKLSLDVANKSDFLFTHAKANLEELKLKKFPVDRFNVIHRGFDIEAVRKIDCSHKKSYSVVVVSRLIADKNIADVLRVFALIYSVEKRARLVIVGDGPEYNKLIILAKSLNIIEVVDFKGYQPQQEVFKILSQCSLFLFLSQKAGERLPNAVKEAMYLKVIPIVSFTPGIDELVENGRTGFILESTEIESISEKIQSIWRLDDLDVMAKAAQQKINDDFDVNKKMQEYISIWNIRN